ncbi:zinc metallopeptidase [Peptostreptococcus equinus]|uniref:Zinc metallopeptidase n=1 Tax=Peptostreptococcus equinus TaxID=3003601 RepID=A0ABY7JLK5_9FIRM|nr:zinc metallopeptidase [Peptostreptococcus sp. CBA3647]WAW14233.1 zinc metallopeptidase [Peptostreptococcus sp. CBA3647]
MYYPYGFYDSTMLLMIPAILISLYASFKVKSVTNKYFKVRSQRGMTGFDVARRILDSNGLSHIPIYPVGGVLSDHYDPRNQTVSLSEEVYHGNSITSISVAAHECGHALQHSKGYFPLTFRTAIVPVVHFASSASWIVIMAGFLVSPRFLYIGIMLFAATVLFQIVTLPVEFNASSRAIKQLEALGISSDDENRECRRVLSAAALTYVAAALSSILQLLRLVLIARMGSDD